MISLRTAMAMNIFLFNMFFMSRLLKKAVCLGEALCDVIGTLELTTRRRRFGGRYKACIPRLLFLQLCSPNISYLSYVAASLILSHIGSREWRTLLFLLFFRLFKTIVYYFLRTLFRTEDKVIE